jgi:hypothetical protein
LAAHQQRLCAAGKAQSNLRKIHRRLSKLRDQLQKWFTEPQTSDIESNNTSHGTAAVVGNYGQVNHAAIGSYPIVAQSTDESSDKFHLSFMTYDT